MIKRKGYVSIYLILPNILGNYNQSFNYTYNNEIPNEYEFNETITSFIEGYIKRKTNVNNMFEMHDEIILNEMKKYMELICLKYLHDSNKGQNINYMCMIIPKNKDNIIHSVRDLCKDSY